MKFLTTIESEVDGPNVNLMRYFAEAIHDHFISDSTVNITSIKTIQQSDPIGSVDIERRTFAYKNVPLSARSTPSKYADRSEVMDIRGKTWQYAEPTDTWRVCVSDKERIDTLAPYSARSYQRLEWEFGPLTDKT